jgi:hypothetical protein
VTPPFSLSCFIEKRRKEKTREENSREYMRIASHTGGRFCDCWTILGSAMPELEAFLSEAKLVQFKEDLLKCGYDEVRMLHDMSPEEIDMMANEVGMKRRHKIKLQQALGRRAGGLTLRKGQEQAQAAVRGVAEAAVIVAVGAAAATAVAGTAAGAETAVAAGATVAAPAGAVAKLQKALEEELKGQEEEILQLRARVQILREEVQILEKSEEQSLRRQPARPEQQPPKKRRRTHTTHTHN